MYLTLEEITAAWKSGAISGEQFLVLKHEFTSQAASTAVTETGLAPTASTAKLSLVSKTMLALGASGMAAGGLAMASGARHRPVEEAVSGAETAAPAPTEPLNRLGLTSPVEHRPVIVGAPQTKIHIGRANLVAQRQLKVAEARRTTSP